MSERDNRLSLILPLSLTVLMLLLQQAADNQLLRLDVNALQQGQIWRLLTAHWVHASMPHALLNLASLLAILWLLPELRPPRRLLTVLLVSSLWIGLILWRWYPHIRLYLGFSGVFYALLACGTVLIWSSPLGRLLALFLLLKVIWEQTLGPIPFSASLSDGKVAIEAHLHGVTSGLLVGLLIRRNNQHLRL